MRYRRTNHHDYSRWLSEHEEDVNWLYDYIFVPDPDGKFEVVVATCTHNDRRRYVSTFWPDEGGRAVRPAFTEPTLAPSVTLSRQRTPSTGRTPEWRA